MNLSARLRHKLKIQQRPAGSDAAGQLLTTWETVAEPWGDILNQYGLEAIKAGAETSTVRVSIRIRYRTGLNAGMRVLHGSTVYDIKAILPDEVGRVFLDLSCEVIK